MVAQCDQDPLDKTILRTAQSIDSRVSPAEERLIQAEQNASACRTAHELVRYRTRRRGGAKARRHGGSAVAGVNATNSRTRR